MAEMSTIAELGVVVSARNEAQAELEKVKNQFKQLDAETKKVSRSMGTNLQGAVNRTRASVTGLATRLAGLAAAYVSVSAVASGFQRSIANTRQLANLSAQTGIAVDRLAALQAIAASVGVSFETLQDAAVEFGQRVQEGLANPASEAGQALRELGIEVQNADGSIRSFDEVLPEMADRFASWQDGAEKTAVAMGLLGEQGRQIVPVLNRGGQALKDSADKARGFRLTLDPQRVREYDRAVNDLSNSFTSFLNDTLNPLLPVLTKVMDSLSGVIDAAREARQQGLSEAMLNQYRKWGERVAELQDQANRASDQIEKLVVRFAQLSAQQRIDEGDTERYEARLAELRAEIDRLNKETEKALEIQDRFAAVIFKDPKFSAEVTDDRDKSKNIRQGMGGLSEVERLAQAAQQQAMQEAVDIAMQQTGLLENLILTYGDYASAVEEAEKRIREAHEHTWEAEMQIAEMRKNLQRQQQEALLDTVQMAGQTLTALFPKSKAAAIAEAIMNTAVGVTRALRDVPFPLNWVQAGLIASAGAAQIGTIRSANLGGGGSARGVRGGGGSRSAPQQTSTVPSRAIQIVMPKGDIWSTERVAELIDRINNEVSNGKTLISTRTKPM